MFVVFFFCGVMTGLKPAPPTADYIITEQQMIRRQYKFRPD